MAEVAKTLQIMNLKREISLPDPAQAHPSTEVQPRNSWDINTPLERRSVCVGDAISYYNRTFPEDMVFLQDDRPVQIDIGSNGLTKITHLDYQQVRTVLGKGASWYKAGKEENVPVNPSRDLAEWTISAGRRELSSVPVLEGVTNGIIIDKDWRVVHTAGYDEKTQYYLTKDYAMDPVPVVPTAEQLNEAKDTIWDIFKEVRYKDRDQNQNSINYQNTVFGLIAAALRPMWQGALPFLVIKKSSPRIGGSVLAEIIGICATGNRTNMKLTYPDTVHEYATKIDAAILQGVPFCSVDNVVPKYVWYNPTLLSQSAGDGNVDIRKFRQNTELTTCSPRTFFVINGINIGITKDVCGRVIPIYLENSKIWQNDRFEVTEDELRERAYILYPKIIWSIATIHQYWIAQGQPDPKECTGNISAYRKLWQIVGGMMQCAGYTHVLDNLKEAQTDYNDADNKIADFLNALGRAFPSGQRFTTATLGELITSQAQEKKKRYNAETKTYGNSDSFDLINNVPHNWFTEAGKFQLSPDMVGMDLTDNYLDAIVAGAAYILRKKKTNGIMKYWLEDKYPER